METRKRFVIAFLSLSACNNYDLVEKLQNPGVTGKSSGMIAFVSSATINASLSNGGTISTFIATFPPCNALNGLALADCACGQMATSAGLPMPTGGYVAWISTAANDMTCRITRTTSPLVGCTIPTGGPTWTNTAGQVVANGYAGLLNGTLVAPINLTETKVTVTSNVWTGTNTNGSGGAAATCTDWTAAASGIYGNSGVNTAGWTNTTTTACGATPYPIYCLGLP